MSHVQLLITTDGRAYLMIQPLGARNQHADGIVRIGGSRHLGQSRLPLQLKGPVMFLVLQPPRNRKLELFYQVRIRKPTKFEVFPLTSKACHVASFQNRWQP